MNYHRYKSRDPNLTRERQFWEKLRRYFPRLCRVDLRSESYSALKNILDELDLVIEETKLKMVERDHLRTKIAQLDSKIKPLDEDRDIVTIKGIEARGLIADIFGMAPSQKEKDLAALAAKMDEVIRPLKDQRNDLSFQENKLVLLDSNLELFKWYRGKIEPIAGRRKDTEDAWNELRNRAAQNSRQIRDAAHIIKDRIKAQHCCPYCGGDLGESPHADHIYPVSKGGRSTERNMVYVCARCNEDKFDLTLSAFIRNNNLDRDAIEARLRRMGKDF